MANARKLPSGNWNIRVGSGEGGKAISFTAPTKKEAELMAAEYKNGKRHPERRTLEECTRAYIDSRRNIRSPSTIAGYEKILRNNYAGIAHLRLCDLTRQNIQRWIDDLSVSHSAKTVSNAFGLLRSSVIYAAGAFDYSVSLPKSQKPLVELPDPAAVIAAVRGSEIELPCMLAIWLGLRMSEIRGLTRASISGDVLSVSDAVITVNGQHIRKHETKTYRARRLRVPPYILSLIAALPPDQQSLTTLSGQAIYKRFSRALAAAGLHHIKFHELRHLNASVMAQLGVPERYAMERGGWSDPTILRNVYQHTFSAASTAVADSIDAYFSSLLSNDSPASPD